eukprot:gene7969-8790_t
MDKLLNEHPLGSCDSVNDYDKIGRIGEGTYGYVYSARHRKSNQLVALKRIILHNEQNDGFPQTSIREISILKSCHHRNIVELYDVVVGTKRDAVFLVFEFCQFDLHALIKSNKNAFREAEIKCLIMQLLAAVEYIHRHWIVHRDIKITNLLYTDSGLLKLADFGLARRVSHPPPQDLTAKVVTLWYRAPEVLLGTTSYSFPVDIWSVGCVLGELLAGQPLMNADTEIDQISAIFSLLGSPNERIWPEVSSLSLIKQGIVNLEREQLRYPYNTLALVLPELSPQGLDLLQGLFTYSPTMRLTAREALRHSYFHSKPYPVEIDLMPKFKQLPR